MTAFDPQNGGEKTEERDLSYYAPHENLSKQPGLAVEGGEEAKKRRKRSSPPHSH